MTLTSTFLTIGFFGLSKLNNNFLLLWNKNNISVTTDSPIDIEKVKVEFGSSVNTISRRNDLDLFKKRSKYTILYDGEVKAPLINKYGENDFLITYDNKYYFSFRQFKFNRRNQHDYNFHLSKRKSKIYVRVEINGQDAMKFERPMVEIDNAEKYLRNSPLTDADRDDD